VRWGNIGYIALVVNLAGLLAFLIPNIMRPANADLGWQREESPCLMTKAIAVYSEHVYVICGDGTIFSHR
jgi:hypothetical protein